MKKKVIVSVIGLIGLVTITFHYIALYSENNGNATSLTPRLNSDGTVMVDKENKK